MTTTDTPTTFDAILDLRRRDQHIDWTAIEKAVGRDEMMSLETRSRDALYEELSLHTRLTADGTLRLGRPQDFSDVRVALNVVRASIEQAYRVAYAHVGGDKEHDLVEEIDDLFYEFSGTLAHIGNGDYS